MTKQPKVSAVIVAYFPDVDGLRRLVSSLDRQSVAPIILVDNTPGGADLAALAKCSENLVCSRLGENKGVAYAQNEGIQFCLAEAATHVLIFDQDSDVPDNYVEWMLRAETVLRLAGMKVGAIGPAFTDKKSDRLSKITSFRWWGLQKRTIRSDCVSPLEVDNIISSGALIRAQVLRDVGGMIDDFFIDWIDIEWCLRAVGRGYRFFVIPEVVMAHSIGYSTKKVLNKIFILHNPFRSFFMLRNALLMTRLPTLSLEKKVGITVFACLTAVKNFFLMSERRALLSSYWRAVSGAFSTRQTSLSYRVFS